MLVFNHNESVGIITMNTITFSAYVSERKLICPCGQLLVYMEQDQITEII